MNHHEPADLHAVWQRAGRAGPDGHVVRDVGAGAAPGEEDAGEIGVVEQPRVGARGSPLHGGPAVLVRRGERALRREAVVDGHADGAGAGDEVVEVGVGGGARGRSHDEAAAVEVDDDGELGGGGVGREVDARAGGADVDVLGDDAGEGVGASGGDGVAAGADDAAALVLAEVGREVEADLGVGIHGRRRAAGTVGGGGGRSAGVRRRKIAGHLQQQMEFDFSRSSQPALTNHAPTTVSLLPESLCSDQE